MKNLIFSLCLSILGSHTLMAQRPTYNQLVDTAFENLLLNKCQPCLEKYEAAFNTSQQNNILDRMRAALCAFKVNNDRQFRYHLDIALARDWEAVESLMASGYPEFQKEKQTDFYRIVNEKIDVYAQNAGCDMALRRELAQIEKDDKDLRQQMSNRLSPAQKDDYWQRITALDATNIERLKTVLDRQGYPSKTLTGARYANTLWSIMQYADLGTIKKYYSLTENSMKNGSIEKPSYAVFVDKYRMLNGEKQLYGSQVIKRGDGTIYFYAIEDEGNVNRRRAEMNLGTIEDYARLFTINYVPVR